MGNPHGSFIWYELLTSDLATARQFYQDVIGWTIDAAPPASGMDYRMIDAGDGKVGGMMQLQPVMIEHGARPGWLGYIGVDDVDATAAAMVADGAVVHMPAHDIEGVGRIAMLADPQGAPFYLMKPIPPAGDPDGVSEAWHPTKHRHCAWNELTTTDQPAAEAFYLRHLGWTRGEALEMGAMGTYQMLDLDGRSFGAVMSSPPGGPPPMWSFYWHVPDLAEAHGRALAAGASVMHGPAEIPGGDYIVIAADPLGAAFALVGPYRPG